MVLHKSLQDSARFSPVAVFRFDQTVFIYLLYAYFQGVYLDIQQMK